MKTRIEPLTTQTTGNSSVKCGCLSMHLTRVKIIIYRFSKIEINRSQPHIGCVDRHPTAQDRCVTESAEKFTTTKKWSAT
jgi:hypothetical protein